MTRDPMGGEPRPSAGGTGARVLVVEDDPSTRALVARVLAGAGYAIIEATDGAQALDLLARADPALVVLDVGLPGVDGFEVCRRLRRDSRVPILMLTGHVAEEDVLRGFELGVDDYLTKPFSPRVLAARVTTVLRRAAEGDRRERERERCVRAGSLELDTWGYEVRMDGQAVRLTPLEFRILHILVANAGRVVPYGRLIEFAWGPEGGSRSRLKVRIHSIRDKLGLPVRQERGIVPVTGAGYALRGF